MSTGRANYEIRRYGPVLVLIALLSTGASSAFGQGPPPSDACLGATPIGNGTFSSSTSAATNDGSATCGSSSTTPDVWYSYTPPCSGTLSADTCGSSYDTVLSLHNAGWCIELGPDLICGDDCVPGPCGGADSCLSWSVTGGTTYLIRVSGWNGSTGDFVLNLEHTAFPTHDVCSNPVVVPSTTHVVPFTDSPSTVCATTDGPVPQCGLSGNGSDVWYFFQPLATCTYRLDTCGSNYDTVLQVYTGTCGSLTPLAGGCNDDDNPFCGGGNNSKLDLFLAAGTQYWIQIGAYGGGGGGSLSFSLGKLDTDGDTTPDCNDACPNDPLKTLPGQCGCGVPDTDTDSDGVADCIDNCPVDPNPTQDDCDTDGFGDACELDCNGDNTPDDCDGTPTIFESLWTGSTGLWSDPGKWCPPIVPQNDLGVVFEVTIPGTGSEVVLDSAATVDSVTIGPQASLFVDASAVLNVTNQLRVEEGAEFAPNPNRAGLTDAVLNAGSILIGALPTLPPIPLGPASMTLDDLMVANVSGDVVVDGTGAVCGLRGGSSPPRLKSLSVGQNCDCPGFRGGGPVGSLNIGGNFLLLGEVDLQVDDDACIVLDGNLENLSSAPGCVDWNNGTLTLNGSGLQSVQLAGEDLGNSPAGLIDNFAIGTINICPDVAVVFFDDTDNLPGGSPCEVQYVNSLNLGSGALLTLAGCNVYYAALLDQGAIIDDSAGGALLQLDVGCPHSCGDVDGSGGTVNLVDFASFAVCFGASPSASTACECSDLNDDGAINLADFATFSLIFSTTSTDSPPNCP